MRLSFAALLGLSLVAAAPAPTPAPPPGPQPSGIERWLHNSRERTASGLEAWQAGQPAAAADALDAALRLAPDSPLARFNAGTGRLAARREGAASLLEEAAADPALAARAFYNLGNARFGGGDLAGAISAYRESLRRESTGADAKFNLELALREQQKQQQQKQQQQNDQQQQRQQQQGSQSPDQKDQPSEQQAQKQPEPTFRDQPEMNAEQAKQILAAVENLEREQRRKEAEQRAAGRAKVEIDW